MHECPRAQKPIEGWLALTHRRSQGRLELRSQKTLVDLIVDNFCAKTPAEARVSAVFCGKVIT